MAIKGHVKALRISLSSFLNMQQAVKGECIISFYCIFSLMNIATKIHLSSLEKELMQNKEWILTKRSVIEKVCVLFGNMHHVYKEILQNENLSLDIFSQDKFGKISKGENYLGLPYVILDYPSVFSKENVFAIRTMFWWGNFFSISLQLAGKSLLTHRAFSKSFFYLKEKNFFICINENQWEHNFEPNNFIHASKLNAINKKQIFERNFFKISKKIGLKDWEDTPEFLEKTFKEIIQFLRLSFPAGEKALLPASPKAGSGL